MWYYVLENTTTAMQQSIAIAEAHHDKDVREFHSRFSEHTAKRDTLKRLKGSRNILFIPQSNNG